VDAPLPQFGVLLAFLDRRDRAERGLVGGLLGGAGPVVEPGDALGDPALERLVDGDPAGVQIVGDTPLVPAFYM